jgi:hypothetical protein
MCHAQHSGDEAVLVLADHVQRPLRYHQLPHLEGGRIPSQSSFCSSGALTLCCVMQMLDIIDSSSKDDSHYLYFCSNKACGRKYDANPSLVFIALSGKL